MSEDANRPDRFDSIADFYGPGGNDRYDPLHNALQRWDLDDYRPLRDVDPDLHRLLCERVGFDIDILVGQGSVKLGLNDRHFVMTWSGDDEELADLVLECAGLISGADRPSDGLAGPD